MLNKCAIIVFMIAIIPIISIDGVSSSTMTISSTIYKDRAILKLLIQKAEDTPSQLLSTISDSYN